MTKHDKQSKPYRIYDKLTHTWYEVTPEQYKEFDRWRTNKRKREQAHGHCVCPRQKWWLCDGMCEDCEFKAAGDTISFDAPITNENGDSVSLLDTLVFSDTDPSDIILDQILMRQLIKRLVELMPEAIEIGKLRQQGFKDEAIADRLGIKRTTFRSRLSKAEEKLREEFGEDYPF